jgi:hypothetical protein
MPALLRVVTALALGSLAVSSVAGAEAIVVVAEDGGFSAQTVQTVRSIASTALRERGILVIEDPRLDAPGPITIETMNVAGDLGAEQLYVLRLGRLRKKVLMSLEELAPPSQATVSAATLTAITIDEADKVIPRLVKSVLDREPVEKGARVATVTETEGEPFQKKPGEGLFIIGVGLAPLGASIGWNYEAEHWRLGVLLQGADDDVSFFGVEGAWIPWDQQISPYLGVGLGVVGPENDGDGVLGTKLEAGVEFFRLHGVRLIAGVNVVIPFDPPPGTDTANFGLHVRVGF